MKTTRLGAVLALAAVAFRVGSPAFATSPCEAKARASAAHVKSARTTWSRR
jgi:hypothetical protein